jgi:alcohol dehydrogenase class IV
MPTFSFPTLIHFGPGVRKDVGAHLKAQGVRRPLLVTDKGLAALPLPKELMESVRAAGLQPALFSDIAGNPVESSVTGGVAAYRAHKADGIIGLGGGAALDVAKAIALMATHPGALFEYEDGRPDARPILGDIPYWVALPTTAGTGSEVGRSAVISDENHIKRIVFSPKLLARAVFADRSSPLCLPPRSRRPQAWTPSPHRGLPGQGLPPDLRRHRLEGLRWPPRPAPLHRGGRHPGPQRHDDGSMMGAIAFQKGSGWCDSARPPPSPTCLRGFANGVMIDSALRFNASNPRPEVRARMARSSASRTRRARFLRWLRELKARIGIPAGLKAARVDRAERTACRARLPGLVSSEQSASGAGARTSVASIRNPWHDRGDAGASPPGPRRPRPQIVNATTETRSRAGRGHAGRHRRKGREGAPRASRSGRAPLLAERKKAIAPSRTPGQEQGRPGHALTSEMGKPITQSRNELTARQGRIRFFLDNVERALADEVVHEKEAWRETITFEPLGLVGNVSAWNYPYFVGSNVFVPALLAGNAVLYKPSEFATLTGLAITEALHAAGVPAAVFAPVIGGAKRRLVEQPLDAVFFTGSYATGARSAAAARQLMRVQLELGARTPSTWPTTVDPAAPATRTASTTRDRAAARASTSTADPRRVREAFVAEVGVRGRRSHDEKTYIGPVAREVHCACWKRVADARPGRDAAPGRGASTAQAYFAPTVSRRRGPRWR